MAARTSKVTLNEKWRERIRVSMLINRLTNHALGKVDLSQTQVRSIEILLRKVAPDLSAVDHTGDVTHRHVARLPEVSKSSAEWQAQYAPQSIASH